MNAVALAPFQPKGDVPEWRLIYDALLERAGFGDIITYAQLDEALGRPFEANRSPFYRARQHMGEMRSRWLVAVPRQGYRVIEAREHLTAAQSHKRRARRQLGLMVRVQEVTDLSVLSAAELATFDSQARINSMLYQVAVHHERRLARIESILREDGRL
jgi:hypothetical protein